MTFVDEVKNAVTPRAALLVIGVLGLQLLFIASYVGALHKPKPTDVAFGVVAPQQMSQQLVSQLDGLPGGPLDPRTVSSEAEAREQIMNRDIDGALIVSPQGRTDTLLVASGGGTVLSSALERILTQVEAGQQRTVRTVDVAPASPDDFDGLSSFYLVVGWCVGGYLCASILAISAGTKPANRQRALIRTAVMAVYAVAGGIGGAVIIGPILGALPGSVWGLAGLGALVVFSVGMITLALEALTGIVGIGLAVLIIVIAGNPSAGGAFPLPMLPDFWRAIGPALPPGAGTWVARSIAYFRGNAVTGPLLVLSAWAVAGTALTLLLSMRRRGGRDDGRTEAASSPSPSGGSTAV
ncbi:integral membrane protein [Streptomyces sp. CBMAI 2042]|uniref:ABC transporter permease n=1 Tax=Streptomyces TaxID=1883 RepID=UPI000F24EDFB|nr:ABC transporter permease [Streptomyces sp. CBMAI 2042]RLV65629.1 integral membrane protein [Streptomyces sp. CBMAI 2042]